MKIVRILVVAALLAAPAASAEQASTYIGIVTDTMCGISHAAMKVSPEAKCVKECVGDARTFQYALADGKNIYRLSDQQTPEKFAGRRVKVTGVLYSKTKILKVDRIEPADWAR